jgi:tripartite-type tricarboxylate transporter receptor subunit TctC
MNGAKRALRTLGFGLCLALPTALAGTPSAAQPAEQFYKGRNVTIVLGHPPGGSYDMYARLAANHMRKHIPGNPNIIVEHRPGGGGVRAVLYFYNQAPRDGSVMGLFPETIAHTQVLQPEIGKWKMQEMSYVGSFTSVNATFVRRKDAPAKTPEEMRRIPSNAGCTGKTSQAYQAAAILKNLGGFQFKIICGYPGSADYVLAMQRGEIDLVSSAWNQWRSNHQTEIQTGVLVPVMQTGLRRNKELQNIPLLQELVDDPTSKKVIEFYSAGSAIGRALMVPPRVPAERLEVLRTAFMNLVKDPDFLRDAERVKAEIDPTPGAEVQQDVADILAAPKDTMDRANKAME